MKKLLIICLLLLTYTNIFAQDKEPTAWEFRWGTVNTQRVFDLDYFIQDTFHFGFQWAASKNMNDEPVPILGYLYSSQHFFNECNDEYRTVLCSNVKLYNMEVS